MTRSLPYDDLELLYVGCGSGWLARKRKDYGKVTGIEDLAYVVGKYTMTFADQKHEIGKYVEIRKKRGGSWLLVVDIFNTDRL